MGVHIGLAVAEAGHEEAMEAQGLPACDRLAALVHHENGVHLHVVVRPIAGGGLQASRVAAGEADGARVLRDVEEVVEGVGDAVVIAVGSETARSGDRDRRERRGLGEEVGDLSAHVAAEEPDGAQHNRAAGPELQREVGGCRARGRGDEARDEGPHRAFGRAAGPNWPRKRPSLQKRT